MVENAVFWINALPINSGMSSTISPADVHDRDHHRFQQTLQNRSWRICRGTRKNSHETPRNPVQNPIYASYQQEIPNVPVGSSTSVQDAASNDVPSPLSLSRRVLLTAYIRLLKLVTRIPLLDFLPPWKSHPIWRHPQRRQ